MSERDTFLRCEQFYLSPPEPPEPQIIGFCLECGKDIYDGDEHISEDCGLFCSDECYENYFSIIKIIENERSK